MGMRRERGSSTPDQLKYRGSVAGRHFDYKEEQQMSTTSKMVQNENLLNDSVPHDDDEIVRNRIHWSNNDAEETEDQPHDHYRAKIVDYSSDSRRMRNPRGGLSTLWMPLTISFVVTALILLTSNVDLVSSCNEAVCASIVSKCTLTQSCKCELRNCSCCRECFDCLTYLYDECCSCVELCPKPNNSHHVEIHSQVGDLKEPMFELFKALTEEKDIQGRWATFTYPIDIDQSWFMPKPEAASSANVYTVANGKIIVDPSKEVVTVNCTVAYMSECMPLNKCRNSCHSMGASYFRWFHDGCCECIGSTCINYGIDESRCSRCSMEDDAEDDLAESDSSDDIENDTGKDT